MKQKIFYTLATFLFSLQCVQAQDFWQQAHYPDTCQIYDMIGLKNGTILFGTDKGIYRSTDLGGTWTHTDISFQTQAFSVDSQGNVYTGCNGLYKSIDNGMSWNLVNPDVPVVSFCCYTNDILFAGNGENILKSSDSGNNWNIVLNIPSQTSYISDFAHTTNGYLYATFTNWMANTDGVYLSKDAGETWQLKTLCGNPFLGIAVNSQDEIFVVGYCGVYKSSDYGNTWVHIKPGWSATDIVIDKEDNIYVSCDWEIGESGVHRSKDNGQTWETLNSGMANTYLDQINISCNNYLFALVTYGYGHDLYRSVLPVIAGMNAIDNKSKPIIFPNPAKDVVYIKTNNESSECSIKLFDISGNLIYSLNTKEEQVNISISNLNKGLYLIEISTKSSNKISKLIIQ